MYKTGTDPPPSPPLLYHYKNKLFCLQRAAQTADFSGASKQHPNRAGGVIREQFGLESTGGRAGVAQGAWDPQR